MSAAPRRLLIPCVSVAGMLLLSYLLGAAVVQYKLPTSEYLHDAFVGGRAWWEQQDELAAALAPAGSAPAADVDDPTRTCDGYTAYTTNEGAHARLLDM